MALSELDFLILIWRCWVDSTKAPGYSRQPVYPTAAKRETTRCTAFHNRRHIISCPANALLAISIVRLALAPISSPSSNLQLAIIYFRDTYNYPWRIRQTS